MSDPIKLTIVRIDPSGDGYDVVALNGKIVLEGDYYHEKVSEKVEGIRIALESLIIPYKEREIKFDDWSDWQDHDYQPDAYERINDYIQRITKLSSAKAEITEEDKEVWLFDGGKAYYLHLYKDGRTWVVECKYGKRDSTLRTTKLASGAPFDVAYKIYAKRLKEKKNGGYEEGDE